MNTYRLIKRQIALKKFYETRLAAVAYYFPYVFILSFLKDRSISPKFILLSNADTEWAIRAILVVSVLAL